MSLFELFLAAVVLDSMVRFVGTQPNYNNNGRNDIIDHFFPPFLKNGRKMARNT
jgi:hypothetical protein